MIEPSDYSAAMELVNTIRRRVESRYRRILFVHEELAGLDAAAKQRENAAGGGNAAGGNAPGGNSAFAESFEDFVFSRIDFSRYKKIDAEEFRLLFDEGLADYSEAFYQKAFAMNSEEIRALILRSYLKIGPFYLCKKTGPLLLSIMRTLHTSLEFAPLLGGGDVSDAEQLRLAATLLDGVVIRHSDDSETKLFVPEGKTGAPGKDGGPLLCGTFCPLGKAYTVALIP